ncbi:MAG: (4Fe-4S)-binding protein [Bacteroidales bacterium]|nr:(4Fe-4S)-binding protein [Bacteroidales bacterium]
MSDQIKQEYTNGEITIVWKPGICIHAAECVKTLPKVYQPGSKPWIKIENARSDELKAQIKKCPSNALSYYLNTVQNTLIL